ncbi:DNA recombination protein RmuC [Prosthecomicrobium sp. N25]|uniref:DNA recombination protein RmuC n=1 Tax=Prosthecomicrobium sp. N25 TaxID=3129254 RepID=UPI0030780D7A
MLDALSALLGRPPSTGEATLAVGAALIGLWLATAALARRARARAAADVLAAEKARELDLRLAEVAKLQAEMTGRMQTMAEVFGARQAELARAVTDRLDGLTHRLGSSMAETSRATGESLSKLHERIAVIDRAQRTIQDLSGQVVSLQAILADKQARGAFGQGRMEAIVADALPPAAYAFQATLSTGVRPDCLIHLPNGAAPLVVDAKFPLESWTALGQAAGEDEAKLAAQRFRRDVLRHVLDIRSKYLIPGETQDTAFLFVPSESIFADLHERFDDVVQRAQRARVVIVSPSLLLLSIQVVQAVLRDHRLREQAHVIQAEVGHLLDDVGRLAERVEKLKVHHAQAGQDLDRILVSAGRIGRRGERIVGLDLGAADALSGNAEAGPAPVRIAGE